MGLVSLPTCHSIMGKKEHLLKVSKSSLTVLKLHFIKRAADTEATVVCVRKANQQREESPYLPNCENKITKCEIERL